MRAQAGGAKLCAVVKADGYGHGLETIAARLTEVGVHAFAVALAEEGLTLRQVGVTAPILVLNGIYDGAHREVARHGLTPVVYDLADLERFAALGAPVHVKLDTGMSRLGVPLTELERFAARLDGAEVSGLMTHLSSAEDDPEATREQLRRFEDARARLATSGIAPPVAHAANSAATIEHPEARYDLVRVGLALYGARPSDTALDLRPVMRVVTSVARVTEIAEGEAVGYGRTWVAPRNSRIATIAMGYGDGLIRAIGGHGEVLIHGRRCPLVGRVSMDLAGVDVTALESCARGDEVVLVGRQGQDEIRPEEVATAAGTIAYEVMTSISPRVPRVTVDGAPGPG